jgi:hypothetical protein
MPTWANNLQDSISKIPIKKGLVEWLKVKALSSSPSTPSTKKVVPGKLETTQSSGFLNIACCPSGLRNISIPPSALSTSSVFSCGKNKREADVRFFFKGDIKLLGISKNPHLIVPMEVSPWEPK